jgi:hypothetical protein
VLGRESARNNDLHNNDVMLQESTRNLISLEEKRKRMQQLSAIDNGFDK